MKNFSQGFINVYKPKGLTSAFVVGKVKKQFNLNKVGHMGTLDPMAEGVLPLAVGKATRLFDLMQIKTKTYVATFTFGFETNSFDSDGDVVAETKVIPLKQDVEKQIVNFVGKQLQVPPNFSAKKINGKRAYELARENVDFELKPKEIEIYSFKLMNQVNECEFEFEISCSSGTYIRSICRDLGRSLNSLCTMTKLIRTQTGFFNLDNSYNFNELMQEKDVNCAIIRIENIFNFEKIIVNESDFNKLKNGLSIATKHVCENCFVYDEKKSLLGIGKAQNGVLKLNIYLLEN